MCPIGRTKPFFRPRLSSDRAGTPACPFHSNEKQQVFQHIERNFGRAPDFLVAKQQYLMFLTGDTKLSTWKMARFDTPLAFHCFSTHKLDP